MFENVHRKAIKEDNKNLGGASGVGGARGVMVIVVGIGHGHTSSNPGRD